MSSSYRIVGPIFVTLGLLASGVCGASASDTPIDSAEHAAKILSIVGGDTMRVIEVSIDDDGLHLVGEGGRTIFLRIEDLHDVDGLRSLLAEGNVVISDDGDTVRFRVGDQERVRFKKGMLRIEADGSDLVRVGDSIEIGEGEVVEGDAVAVGGSVTVAGTVMGDVVAIGGQMHLEPTAIVHGQAVCVGGKLTRDPGSKVSGEVVSIGPGLVLPFLFQHREREHHGGGLRTATMVFFMIAFVMALVTLVFMALWGSRIQGMAALVPTETLRFGLTGLVTWMLAPWMCILLAITCVGVLFIPLFVVLLVFAFAAGLAAVYVTAGAWMTRDRAAGGGQIRTALLGVATIHGLSVIGAFVGGFVPIFKPLGVALFVFGLVLLGLAGTIGLGAVLYTRFGKRHIPPLGLPGTLDAPPFPGETSPPQAPAI